MFRTSRFLSLAALSLALVGAGGCTTASRVGVTSDFDHAVNFRAFKTWAWFPQQPSDTQGGPSGGKYESFVDQRIRAAVAIEMSKKGLTEVEKAPDVYVAYSTRVEDKQQVSSPYYNGYGMPYYGYGYYGRNYQPVTQYKAGTVIIDIVDARRKELAWRGTGMAQVDQNTISEPEAYRIVGGILNAYPPQDNQARR